MCAIAGILGATGPRDEAVITAMNGVQRHRGPDACGVGVYPGAVLGHRRLSIIDLSDRARQPFESRDGRHVLVFNGEIYNYKELRQELEGGWQFRSESDSEVLLAAFARWGEGCLDRLNGMFAFCVYMPETREAFFARDRFGQKPFYFAELGGRLVFASEVKALLSAGVPSRPNPATWARYLLKSSYDDTADTYFAGVSQLEPGECARYRPDTGLRRRRYYRVADHIEPRDVGVAEAAAHIRELLIDAARLHMRSDVPVGVALSGGFDSSALLACVDLSGALHDGVKCVSVDFGSHLSERQWIEAAASHHGLQSHIVSYSQTEFRESIEPMMWHLEGPLGGLMNCALAKVMQTAHEHGITVIQDGTGLDEAFAGYRNHHNLYLGSLLEANDPKLVAALGDYARNWGVDEKTARQAGAAEITRTGTTIDGTVPVRPELLDPGFAAAYPEDAVPQAATGDRVRDALVDFLQTRKIPRNTRMKDRISMAYGLELRLPFLDHRLVEYALSLPTEYYFLKGRSKSILREALAGDMDDTVRLAAKRSIQSPQGEWLRQNPMREYVHDLIASDSFAGRGMFDPAKCRAAFERFCAGEGDNSFFVWQWINVEEWFRTFVDGDPLSAPKPMCPEIWTREPATRPAAEATAGQA